MAMFSPYLLANCPDDGRCSSEPVLANRSAHAWANFARVGDHFSPPTPTSLRALLCSVTRSSASLAVSADPVPPLAVPLEPASSRGLTLTTLFAPAPLVPVWFLASGSLLTTRPSILTRHRCSP